MTPVAATSTTSPRSKSTSRKRVGFWLPLGLICLVSVTLPGSPLLGEWESLSVFTIFGSQTHDMTFAITRDANIGGQGYPLLEISRDLINGLNLPYTVDFIRLPVKLIGAVGLIAFAIVARRWFGTWPALAATALLAVNPAYHQYQNELIIAGPSLAVFVILLERLQFLSRKPTSWIGWLTLAPVWALLLTMYGPSRIYSTVLVAAWLVLCTVRALRRNSGFPVAKMAIRISVSVVLVPLLLVLASPQNLHYFTVRLLFPGSAETVLVQESVQGIARVLLTNGRVMVESFFLGGSGAYHSTFVEATLIQGRFATIPLLLSPFVCAAFGWVIWQSWKYRRAGMNRYLAILGLAALTSLPMLTSSVVAGELGPEPTLVNHRLVYFTIPAYLALGALVAILGEKRGKRRTLTSVLAVTLVVLGTIQIQNGASNFLVRAERTDPFLNGERGHVQWLSGYGFGQKSASQGSHFQQHQQYRRWGMDAARVLRAEDRPEVVILSTSIRCFPEARLRTQTVHEMDGKNYHAVFLGLYLANALDGEVTGYVHLPSTHEPVQAVGFKNGVFPGPLGLSDSGTFEHISPDTDKALVAVSRDSQTPAVIVATTPAELKAAQTLLEEKGRDYVVRQSDLTCFERDQ